MEGRQLESPAAVRAGRAVKPDVNKKQITYESLTKWDTNMNTMEGNLNMMAKDANLNVTVSGLTVIQWAAICFAAGGVGALAVVLFS